MKVTIGNPNLGGTVEIEVADSGPTDAQVTAALDALRFASTTAKAHYLANETDEEKANREVMEENQQLQLKTLRKQNDQMRKFLDD